VIPRDVELVRNPARELLVAAQAATARTEKPVFADLHARKVEIVPVVMSASVRRVRVARVAGASVDVKREENALADPNALADSNAIAGARKAKNADPTASVAARKVVNATVDLTVNTASNWAQE
jgi:hypothetical protein